MPKNCDAGRSLCGDGLLVAVNSAHLWQLDGQGEGMEMRCAPC